MGVYDFDVRSVNFAKFNEPKRTDSSFRNRSQPIHHKGISILEEIRNVDGNPIVDMIKHFPSSDPLHLLDEGVMKKNLNIWMKGTSVYNNKWSKQIKTALSENILQWNKECPSDINRKVRGLQFLSYWKATEFRTMLLYYGIVAFKDVLEDELYDHFLYLCLAVRICSCKYYVKRYKTIARDLFSDYCKQFVIFYGSNAVVSNIHNISHIYEDVEEFGSLTDISTYPFENFLKEIKMRIQPSNMPIKQISRRLAEMSFDILDNPPINFDVRRLEKEVWIPELKYDFNLNDKLIYKFILITPNVYFSVKKPGDRWFLTKGGEIVQMSYALRMRNSYFICGSPIKSMTDFFTRPYFSHKTDIYLSNGEKGEEKMYEFSEIKAKLMCLSYKEDYVYIPLLHSIDECLEYFQTK